jgi:tetratricopeptide (TPR) repeat protein
MDVPAQSPFVRSRLPWVIALGAIAVYLVTLNKWVSLNSLSAVTSFLNPKLDPLGTLSAPLFYLITLPLQLLPGSIQLQGLNLLSASCAALTLALLARSIAILPHDRTREERHRLQGSSLLNVPLAWVPPAIAAAVLAFQLSFWEHATAATGEMFNLLLLAYVVRCLLEFRLDHRESWLTRMSLVYGLAITNNWAMIGFFPLVLAAVIWIRGMSFFQAGFLLRMLVCGIIGLLPYFIVPLIISLQENSPLSLFEALKTELQLQYYSLRRTPRLIALLAALTSFVPVFAISIRWPSTFGDTSAFGNLLINYAFRTVYLVFTAFILWMMLGADFAPRAQFERILARLTSPGVAPGYLSAYYLAALALGYFLGYMLMVFGLPEPKRHRRKESTPQPLMQAAAALPSVAAAAVAITLAYSNFPAVQLNNGQLLKDYTSRILEILPAEPSVLLADQPQILTLAQTLLTQRNLENTHLTVNTAALRSSLYHQDLNRRAPNLWPSYFDNTNLLGRAIAAAPLALVLSEVATKSPTFYLHASFGYYFERLNLHPENLAYRLTFWNTNSLSPVPLSPEQLQKTTSFYENLDLSALLSPAAQKAADARTVARWYSQALDFWAVTLLRSGNNPTDSAEKILSLALQLNPENRAAEINLQSLQARTKNQPSPFLGKNTDQILGKRYRRWDQLISVNGPIDDASACLDLGRQLLDNQEIRLARQAVVELKRAYEIAPPETRPLTGFYLAVALSGSGRFSESISVIHEVLKEHQQYPLGENYLFTLYSIEAEIIYARDNNLPAAEALLLQRLREYPDNLKLINALGSLYLRAGEPDRSLALIDDQLARLSQTPDSPERSELLNNKLLILMQLKRFNEATPLITQALSRNPDDASMLLNQSVVYIGSSNYVGALTSLDHLLDLYPDHQTAKFNRAIARLKAGQLDGARQDYLDLLEATPNFYPANFGLADIAWQQKNYKEAAKNFEAYLSRTPTPDSAEAQDVSNRLEQIRAGKL